MNEAGTESPKWTQNATRRHALVRGMLEAPSTPALVLFATFIGFGVLARETGFTFGQALFTTATVWALPGQVVLADEIAKGGTIAGATFAVVLTAIRLLPLVVSLAPYWRDEQTPRWVLFFMSHFVAITVWVESTRRLPLLPQELRVPYYLGFAATLLVFNISATGIGYELAGSVPLTISAALLFLTPIYFFLSMIASIQNNMDRLALVIGFFLGPVLFLIAPGFDLLLTGLIGGSAAYFLAKILVRSR